MTTLFSSLRMVPIDFNQFMTFSKSFVQAYPKTVVFSGAAVICYLVLRKPVKDAMSKSFVENYTKGLPEINPMLHSFRLDLEEYLAELDQENKSEIRHSNIPKNIIKLLEIGIGPGSSLDYYWGKAIEVIGVEPNPYFVEVLNKKRATFPFFTVFKGYSEDLSSIPNCSIDVVVSSLTMCSVHNLKKSIKEIKRVLKVGGRYYFYEHQACHESWRRYLIQLFYTPYWILMMDGCHPARQIYKAIEREGFDMTNVEVTLGPMIDIIRPVTIGYAIRV